MTNLFPELSTRLNESVLIAMAEVIQPRSPFQLKKFVVGAHDSVEMRYAQCVTEIQALYYTIKGVSLEMKIKEIKAARLRETDDEIDALEAEKIDLELEQTRLVGLGAFRELETLLDIFEQFPKKFTRQEIDQNQADYWAKRLNKQAIMETLGGTQANASHLMALSQIQEGETDEVLHLEN